MENWNLWNLCDRCGICWDIFMLFLNILTWNLWRIFSCETVRCSLRTCWNGTVKPSMIFNMTLITVARTLFSLILRASLGRIGAHNTLLACAERYGMRNSFKTLFRHSPLSTPKERFYWKIKLYFVEYV